ncbi:MAG: hypothetical protein LBT86_07625 [Deltaproteobacteria bacterium]|jgi:hypothetical protein|nr:hypothetical protein [Deltaproteobacteria bacterium]
MIVKILEIAKSQMALFLAIALTAPLVSGRAGGKIPPKFVVVKRYTARYQPIDDSRAAAAKANQATAVNAFMKMATSAAEGYLRVAATKAKRSKKP